MDNQSLSPAAQQIIDAFASSDSMALKDLIAASGLTRMKFTPQLRRLLSMKRLSVRVVSAAGSSICQRVDGHQGKQVYIIPYMGQSAASAPIVEDAVDVRLQQLEQENKLLKQKVEELERRCDHFGRTYTEQELQQIVTFLQSSSESND
ncbi:hypothetical protein EDC56_0169 [Sinobacterium caligoides]|uniref:Uncharacterized protein n=1 Tax=Sinobacterium caligoides TaxID=933926 RepID=A0A3N2DXR8_9GAMM|nr:hypothetical protein [Sinobacterium caligoides]ROS04656.1 hypothetical protein EDC56_0169 [Sinobacterium caligoides]